MNCVNEDDLIMCEGMTHSEVCQDWQEGQLLTEQTVAYWLMRY